MVTRRRFLGYSAAGVVAAASGCRPVDFDHLTHRERRGMVSHPSLKARKALAERKNLFLGYPVNMKLPPEAFFSWREQLRSVGIGDFPYNNVGDPFRPGPIPFNTHDFERELILRFGRLYGFPPENVWGFLSHSGTDSNMHGMYMGRTLLKGRTGRLPKCYFTREAHYSIQILRDLLGLETLWVDTLPDASMDPEDLARKLAANPDHPALVVATIGTTFKGAIDRVDRIQQVLQGSESYLHLDAALFGGYLPHTKGVDEIRYASREDPARARYDSIAVSCHKFFGFPSPAGLFITTQSNFDEFNALYSRIHDPEYIGHVPGTITCSRDAVKPAEFYFFSTPQAIARQAEDARTILSHTDHLLEQLERHFPDLQARRVNDLSNTIFFRSPGRRVVEKYSLATMHLETEGGKQEYAHVVVMPHVDRKVLTEFLTDLDQAVS